MLRQLMTAGAIALMTATAGPLAAQSLPAEGLSDMTDAERATFRSEVRAYLLENPEVLMEAIAVLEERQVAEQAANDADVVLANAEALFEDPNSFVGGNPDGDFTIVEFLDYRCGYCRRAHPEVAELIESDGNIRLIVKEFPILGEQSVLASRFALAVREIEGDSAYKLASDELMNLRGNVTEDSLSDLSELLGFRTPDVFAAMNSENVQRIIVETRALAERLSISGTPSFVFGTEMVRGYVPLDGMREIVAEERSEG